MAEIETYFFESYALYEVVHSNPNYIKYTYNVAIVTTKSNLMELHYALLKLYGKEKADEIYDFYLPFVIEIEDFIIKSSNFWRAQHAGHKFSYIDCLGYTIAKLKNIKFLTGDKEFENLDNVEFVK